MVTRVLASAPTQDEHSAINQQSKTSEVAWRNRQAKYNAFARQTLRHSKRNSLRAAVGGTPWRKIAPCRGISPPKGFGALDDELITRRLPKRLLPQSFPQLCAV